MNDVFNFYSVLFTCRGGMIDHDYLKDVVFPKISEDAKYTLYSPLQYGEIDIASRNLRANRCSGGDGISIDYRNFGL